jgi:hypothetical protein
MKSHAPHTSPIIATRERVSISWSLMLWTLRTFLSFVRRGDLVPGILGARPGTTTPDDIILADAIGAAANSIAENPDLPS